ncbi:hypothetical protein I3843_02G062900 [Carya illinoinensis]|nr:hypothetical protein I3843_02G062900 [Carya illinoinensis]
MTTLIQETQLPPYRRNLEDLLCGSDMVPYPEPYQTAYQQRRLGALGKEWHPSMRLAVGPDFSVDPDYQMLPLADLEFFPEPFPEFVDAMDWEPENEVQSDDTDSEYNVTEDYITGGEPGTFSSISSGDPESSAEDSEADTRMDSLRRSRRKEAEVEIMTSSGRIVKRRNLDECDGNSARGSQTRKSRNGRKSSKRKSSTLKSFRPQRAAARNALTLFSKITGMSTECEDEDGWENLSESKSALQDSIIGSDESDQSLPNEQSKHLNGKEVSLDQSKDAVECYELPEYHEEGGNWRRLVLKLPIQDSSKLVLPGSTLHKSNYEAGLVGSSSKASQAAIKENGDQKSSRDPRYHSGDVNCSIIEKLDEVEDQLNLSESYDTGQIKWGGAKARTYQASEIWGRHVIRCSCLVSCKSGWS